MRVLESFVDENFFLAILLVAAVIAVETRGKPILGTCMGVILERNLIGSLAIVCVRGLGLGACGKVGMGGLPECI